MRRKSCAAAACCEWLWGVARVYELQPALAALGRSLGRAQGLPPPSLQTSVLKFASELLRADRDVVLAAVAIDGTALQFAGDLLRGSMEVAAAAARSAGARALHFIAEPLSASDPELVAAGSGKDVVLTLQMSYQEEALEVVAVNLGGDEVARLTVGSEDLGSMRQRLASQANVFSSTLRLVLPSGKLLRPYESDRMPAREALAC